MTLELRRVTAGYGAHLVLRDVDVVVPDGAVVALLGPNGAGKTTLLRVAAGLLPAMRGKVILDDTDVTGWPAHRLARAGVWLVPEHRAVFGGLSVRANLRMQGRSAPPPALAGRLDQRAGTLSGGEQHLLALARLDLATAQVALIDEVSMGLAPAAVADVYDRLRALAARGTGVLLVEQQVARALAVADYVYVLGKGRVVFVGEPAQLDDAHVRESYLGVSA